MKTNTSPQKPPNLVRGILLNTAILMTGMILVVLVLFMLQKQYAAKQTQDKLSHSLDAITDILDTNTKESDLLAVRVHRDNQAIVNDIAELIFHPDYSGLSKSAGTDKSAELADLANLVGEDIELFIVGEDGFIQSASQRERVGLHLVHDGHFSEEQLKHLQRNESAADHAYKGTYAETFDASGNKTMDSDPVRGSFGNQEKETCFYSNVSSAGETLVLESQTGTMTTLLANIGDIGTVLSNAVMENNGFLFAVNQDGAFTYFDDGNVVFSGENISAGGLNNDILQENYRGVQRIGGLNYQCQSRSYSSSLYGDRIILCAVQPDQLASREIFITSLFTIIVFAGIAIIIMIYSIFLKTDPEQIVGYDEKIVKKRRSAIRHDIGIKNVEAFRFAGKQYYFKVGIARRIAPVILLGLSIILLVSWNSQRLTMLTKNMISADSSMVQLESLFETSNGNSELLTSAYEQHYLAKIKLVSYLIQTEPDALTGKEASFAEDDVICTYLDDRFNPILGENGKPIVSVKNSSVLQRLAKQNGIDEIFIFDDHGHIISSGNDTWKFTLSTNTQDQSYPFRKIISGELNDLVQEPMVNDVGNARQYMSTVLYYYTLEGDGEHAGIYVPGAAYEEYTAKGAYMYENEPYEVVRHRGMIQAGISDVRIDRILETASPSYLIEQFEVGDGGYAMIFDNTEDHVCLWSPVSSDIGKTAEALKISSNGFSGYYKGLCKIGGTKYIQYIKYDNNFWVALNMPQAVVFAGNFKVAVLSTIISAIFYGIMFFFCTVSNEEEEIALGARMEEMMEKEENHGHNISWSSMTVNQKMARLVRVVAALLGCVVIAATVFEQRIFGELSAFHYILTGNWDKGLNYFACFYCVIILIYIAIGASVISMLVSFVIKNMGNRVETIGRLLLSVIKYGSVLFGTFYCLTVLGISTAGVVTSAGIFSVVVGLGAQSLISDILSGIFIIFEGSFRVGDIVDIDGFCGYVREIGIRTTLVEDYLGDVKIFNNSKISGILNRTKKDSYVLCKVGISYNEDIERVEKVLFANLPEIKSRIPGLIGELRYSGVLKLDDSAVIIGIGGRCHEGEKRFFVRRLLREILILFRDNNVNIPYPQLTISYEGENSKEHNESTENQKRE